MTSSNHPYFFFRRFVSDPVMQVMVDLETLSLQPDAAIISIGAVKFNFTGEVNTERFYMNVSAADSKRNGLHVCENTVKWWSEQSQAAKDALLVDPRPLDFALKAFNNWLGSPPFRVWSNGADFDCIILQNVYRATGISCPWSYREHRCYKTIKALLSDGIAPPPDVGVAHNALDDAQFQVDYLLKMVLGRDSLAR